MSDRVYLSNLLMENIRSFERFEVEFGPGLNLITGGNHQGKTTCLDTLRMFFEGGVNWDLLRKGQLTAKAAVGWSDGVYAVKTMDKAASSEARDKYELEARGPSGELKRRAAEMIADRVKKGSFDPEAFLAAEPRARAGFLVKHLNLIFGPEEINSALAVFREVLPPIAGPVPLERFDEIAATIYERRRLLNVEDRDARGAMEDLKAGIPASVDENAGQTLADAEQLLESLRARIVTETRALQRSRDEKLETLREAARQAKQEIDLELARQVSVNDAAYETARQAALDTIEPQLTAAATAVGEARGRNSQLQQVTGIRRAIEERQSRLEGLTRGISVHTKALEALDRLKHDRLAGLPIDGLHIGYDAQKRPEIRINGVNLDSLSGQEALFLAFQCVLFAAGESPIVISEGDVLNRAHLVKLAKMCLEADPPIQLILARHNEEKGVRVERFDDRQALEDLGNALV